MKTEFVLERKCRPKTLEQVVGQAAVVRTISNAVKTDKLHHAYLFVGQFGSGKTSIARILAAMENCEVSPGLHPCGKCVICKEIFEGTHADIKEIDAASAAGHADDVRVLKIESLYNAIDGARTKYYIIDECHRMSPSAADALLKLLEEPPAKVRFVLCTTDVGKMKPAIISRCQRHDFTQIFWMQMAESLTNVAKDEGISIDPGAINVCAKAAKGSMRSALNYLEKLKTSAAEAGHITQVLAEKEFGYIPEAMVFKLIDELLQEEGSTDATQAFRLINKMLVNGLEFEPICDAIIQHLDMMVVGMTSGRAAEFTQLTEDGKAHLIRQLKYCRDHDKLRCILSSMEKISASRQWVAYNANPESALRKWFIESILLFRK